MARTGLAVLAMVVRVLPLLPIAILVAAILAGGVAVAAWPKAKGKSILLVGPPKSGKTTLATFLAKGTIPDSYVRTMGTKTARPGTIKLADYEFKLEAVHDAAGEREARSEWRERAAQVDLIIYCLSYAEADDSDYADRVRLDTDQIHDWKERSEIRKDAAVVVVASHLDCHPEFTGTVAGEPTGAAANLASATEAVGRALENLGSGTSLIAGDLSTVEGCAAVAQGLMESVWGDE